MGTLDRPILFAGYLVRCPLGGYVWQTLHHLEGLRRLGLDVYFWEDTRHVPEAFHPLRQESGTDYDQGIAVARRVLGQHGFGDRWVFHDAGRDRWHGLGEGAAKALLADAGLVINAGGVHRFTADELHGKRSIYVDMDPTFCQLKIASGDRGFRELVESHDLRFSYGENIGTARSPVPTAGIEWLPTRPPVVTDLWRATAPVPGAAFTTVGTWDSAGRDLIVDGERYTWRKRTEWLKVLDVPGRVPRARFRVAMQVKDPADQELLATHGWDVVDPLAVSSRPEDYQAFLRGSLGEFTAAKDMNVRLRSGWFSDRSVCYLAAGRPVVMQDTGFGDVLPTGRGLYAYADVAGAVAALEAIADDPVAAGQAAQELARERFEATDVLGAMLDRL